MAYIFIVKPGHTPSLIFGAEILFVPVNHHLDPIRIMHGSQDQYDIIQNLSGRFISLCSHIIGQLHGHLAGCYFSGMNGTVHHDHCFTLGNEFFSFFRPQFSRIRKSLLYLSVFSKMLMIVLRSDHSHNKRIPHCCFAYFLHLNTRALLPEDHEIFNDLVHIRKFSVCTDFESQKIPRRLDLSRCVLK